MENKFFHVEAVDDVMVVIYKNKTPLERLRIAFGLWRSTIILLSNSLHSLHPDWSEKKIERETARRMSHGTV